MGEDEPCPEVQRVIEQYAAEPVADEAVSNALREALSRVRMKKTRRRCRPPRIAPREKLS